MKALPVLIIAFIMFSCGTGNNNDPDPCANNDFYVKFTFDGNQVEFPTKKGLCYMDDPIDPFQLIIIADEKQELGWYEQEEGVWLYIETTYPPVVGTYDANGSYMSTVFEYFKYNSDTTSLINSLSYGDNSKIEITSVTKSCNDYIVEGVFYGVLYDGVNDHTLSDGKFRVIID